MSLAGIAKANTAIVAQKHYVTSQGTAVDIGELVDHAMQSSHHYSPDALKALLEKHPIKRVPTPPNIEVVASKTGEAARTMAARFDVVPVALNFASAKNPGGGYVSGAKAQEEDLARCSALYYTQLSHREYYDANRKFQSMLYLDHIIYSGAVPFFRDEKYELLDSPVPISVITAPAPNAGEALRRDAKAGTKILESLHRRAGMVLAVAEEQRHRHLVLGAWGCGVFRNSPTEVAQAFGSWLENPRFAGAFDEVVFAIYERGRESTRMAAFQKRFH